MGKILMAFLSYVGMKLIFVTSNILVANVLHSEEANMGIETIIILMLMTFILGLVVAHDIRNEVV